MESFIQNTNLKRTWHSFQSTALHSLQESRTIAKANSKSRLFPDLTATAKPFASMPQPECKKSEPQLVQIRSIIEEISYKIAEDQSKSKRQVNSKFMRHFYYRGITRIGKHLLMNAPKVVSDLYDKELSARMESRQKAKGPPTTFSQGFLKHINCLYYAVQNTVFFVSVEDLLETQDPSLIQIPYVTQQVRNQVITIIQIVGENLMFPAYETVLAIVYPWQIQFFAWQSQNLVKARVSNSNFNNSKLNTLKPLRFVHSLPSQRIKSIDVNSDGRLFFFDQRGFLHQIFPAEETRFLVCKTGKYSIRNYINSSHNTFEVWSSKQAKLNSLMSLASNIAQVSKYFFPSTIEAETVFCDSKRSLLFALLKKNTKLIFGSENELFVVCYCIKQKAKLLHKFSEKLFSEKYGSHIQGYQPSSYLIDSIHRAPAMYQNANLAVLTKSGIMVILQVQLNDAKVIDIIRPPDHRMFESTIKLSKFQQFSPNSMNEYQVCSFVIDKSKTICTLKRQSRTYTYMATSSQLSNAIDVNQQINLMQLEIYNQGRKVDVHVTGDINQQVKGIQYYQQNDDDLYSQLCSQTFTTPKSYIFQSQTKLQLIRHLRLIDILFTALCLLSNEGLYRKFSRLQSIPKQTLILKLFLSSSKGFSVVSNPVIALNQLSAMFLQIIADQTGRYYYCCQTAGDIAVYWNQISQFINNQPKLQASKLVRTMSRLKQDQNYNKFNSRQQFSKVHSQLKIGYSQYYEYNKINRNIIQYSQQLLQRIAQGETFYSVKFASTVIPNSNTFYDFPTTQTKNPQLAIKFKLSVLTLYLGHLSQSVWNVPLRAISKKFSLFLINKLESLLKYIDRNRSSFQIYESSVKNEAIALNLQCITKTIIKIKDLLFLLNNVPTASCNWRFVQALQKQQQLQDCMFWSIHREYKHYIINKWQSMFTSFVTPAFMKLVMLYGQIEELSSKQEIKEQLQNQTQINSFPAYFIKYLSEIKRFTKVDIDQILRNGHKFIKSNVPIEKIHNDNQFKVPIQIQQMFERYSKVQTEISEDDLATLIQLLMYDTKLKLTIVNKHNLMILLRKNLPNSPKLQYLQKCISVQYEVYRYYMQKITPEKPNRKIAILPFIKPKPTQKRQDPQTLLLLRFTTLTQDRLKQLIWITNDSWLMADYCLCFNELQQFNGVLKRACTEYVTISPRPSSFQAYIQRFLLNFAIKSKHNTNILQIIYSVVGQYLHKTIETSEFIKQWLEFAKVSQITDKNIWLPKLLIKLGYTPNQIFNTLTQHMDSSFNSLITLESQTMYCLKFLQCFVLTKKYLPNRSYDLTNRVTKHIDALQRNTIISQKAGLGLRKMLDQLVSNSSSI